MKVISDFSSDGECLGCARKPDDYVLQGTEELIAEDSSILVDRETLHKQSYLDSSAQEYARNRKAQYPTIATQLDYIFHNGVTRWKSDIIDPIKTEYPKPE